MVVDWLWAIGRQRYATGSCGIASDRFSPDDCAAGEQKRRPRDK